MLMQNSHPIAFSSQTIGDQFQGKTIYEKDLMDVVLVVQKWMSYLLGWHFVIWTDQRNLKFMMEQKEIRAGYQKWASKLLGYHFEIEYKAVKTNNVVDALSLYPTMNQFQ